MAQEIAEVEELETGDSVTLKGNGLDVSGEVINIDTWDDDRLVACVETDETVLTVKKSRPHPLQVDNGLMLIGGVGKARVSRV